MSLSLEHVFHALSIALNSSSYPLSREALSNQLAEAYRVPETFRRYLIRHAPVEFAEAKGFFQSLFQPDDRARIMPAVEEGIQSLTHLPARAATVRWREYRDHNIIWPLLTFRGIGFEAAILDERGVDHGFPARRYDLMLLLRRGLFEEMDEEAYWSGTYARSDS
jgi:hypothetical protein